MAEDTFSLRAVAGGGAGMGGLLGGGEVVGGRGRGKGGINNSNGNIHRQDRRAVVLCARSVYWSLVFLQSTAEFVFLIFVELFNTVMLRVRI